MNDRMTLGYQPRHNRTTWPENTHDWLVFDAGPPRHWPEAYERFHERVAIRQRYNRGQKPWAPGRHRTALWHPGGYGRFSGIQDRVYGADWAKRYRAA